MERQRLEYLLSQFPKLKIAVIGDLFLDEWLHVDRSLDEVSRETGLTAYQVVGKRLYAGAAGTVLNNLAALEVGTLSAVGFVGDDGEGFELLRLLRGQNIDTSHVTVSGDILTPTYSKPLFMDGNRVKESNRFDYKNVRPTPAALEQEIIASIRGIAGDFDAIIALDQLDEEGKGVLTPQVREELSAIAEKHPALLMYADSRRFISKFRKITVKCNDIEATKLFDLNNDTIQPLETIESCAKMLAKITERHVFVTCGRRGAVSLSRNGSMRFSPAIPVSGETDIVGAGDAFTSGAVAALCAGGNCGEAAFIGNLVASITVQVIGATGTASRRQVLERFDETLKQHVCKE